MPFFVSILIQAPAAQTIDKDVGPCCRTCTASEAHGGEKEPRDHYHAGSALCGDRESALIADAGLTLSLHAANLSLAREFGLTASHCRISLDMLPQNSLPTAALSLNFEGKMKNNFMLIDQRYPKAPEAPR